MRRWGFIGCWFLIVAASAQGALPECPPAGDDTAIEGWRNAAVQAILSGETPAVATRIESCFGESVPACVQRARDFAERTRLVDSGATDFTAKSDARKQPPRELLDEVDADFNFSLRADIETVARSKGWPVVRYKSRFSGGFDPETPSLIMIRVPGDKVTPPVDYDRYLNIPLPADPEPEALNPVPTQPMVSPAEFRAETSSGRALPRTFTIVTVQRKNASDLSKVYFQMFNRQGAGNAKFTPQAPTSVTGCYSCHVNGVREISPLGYHVRAGERQMPPEMWRAVKEMNDSMATNMGFLPADWRGAVAPNTSRQGKYLVPAGFGPIVGPLVPLTRETRTDAQGNPVLSFPTRTKDFILSCAARRPVVSVIDIFNRPPGRNNVYTFTQDPPVRWEKVRDAMNCASCHNNRVRGAINEGTSWREVDFKILVDQSMPWGWHRNPMERGSPTKAVVDLLNPNERIALANCLQAEWEQERVRTEDWLKEQGCGR